VAATRGGRPFDAKTGDAILDATIQLVIEGGFGRLRVDAVAARAGVSKATIYRRWRSKSELLHAMLSRIEETVQRPDTGDLRTDLQVLLRGAVDEFVESESAQLMPQLSAEAQFNPDVRALLHSYARERRAAAGEIFERAGARGELRDDLDLEVVIDMLTAPIFIRKLITGGPIDSHVIDETIELLLRGVLRGDDGRGG
jgi:AcrR family transcriptional regulator